MQYFYSYLQTHTILSAPFIAELNNSIQQFHKAKHEYLHTIDQQINYVYFLQKGLAVSFENRSGIQTVTDLWQPENLLIPNTYNRGLATRSKTNLKLLSNATLIEIEINKISKLVHYPEGIALYKHFLDSELKRKQNLILCFKDNNHEERIRLLLKNYKPFFDHLTHSQLASFIGTSRSNFSTIISKINQES